MTKKGANMYLFKTINLFFVFIITTQLLISANWPNFLGPNRDGISTESGLELEWVKHPPVIKWEFLLNDGGFTGPCVANNKVYVINRSEDQDIVTALDLKTGKVIWTFKYFEGGKKNYGYAKSTPTFDNGKLYTISRLGLAFCLDAQTGKKIWSQNIVSKFDGQRTRWDYSHSPLIDGNKLLLVPGGDKGVVALDKNSGKVIWEGGNNDPVGYSTPTILTINKQKQYVFISGKKLMGMDPNSGNVLWDYPWSTKYDINVAVPLLVSENKIFITSGYKHGCALIQIEGKKATKVWENQNVMAHFSTPIFYNGFIYANSDPDNLVCLNPKNGNIVWQATGYQKGGLILVEGHLIALGGRSGTVHLVEATEKKYNLKGSFTPLGGQSWTAPVLANKQLIIRNKKKVVCIDLTIN
jgi:outer membrane protein assembly factor BamB